MRWGYTCSSEEFEASELARHAVLAEDVGFEFVTVSDHFHPWTQSQGHSPFAWTTVGAISALTRRVSIGTGVTCPMIRGTRRSSPRHPPLLEVSNGRFFLGVGTGEALNEHITGERWPPIDVRRSMLAEAVEIIWRLWDRRDRRPPGRALRARERPALLGPQVASPYRVRRIGHEGRGARRRDRRRPVVDGTRSRDGRGLLRRRRDRRGGRPADGLLRHRHRPSRGNRTRDLAQRAGIPGQLSQDLPTWTHFEQAAQLVTPEHIRSTIVCGADVDAVRNAVQTYADAGFTSLHFHQVGPDQRGFLEWWRGRRAR
ncbi:MAG: TIGR03557 family F420-dependent LLM class oxidoreductase [Ilumatobacteraceae bacterium]